MKTSIRPKGLRSAIVMIMALALIALAPDRRLESEQHVEAAWSKEIERRSHIAL